MPGLVKRGEVWHINKRINGQRICESTGTAELQEAQRYLVRKLEIHRQAMVYGQRAKRTFDSATARFVDTHQHKRSLSDDIGHISKLMPFIGNLTLEAIHMGALESFIEARRKEGVKTRTINHGLQVVRRILNLAASLWMDEHGQTWLQAAPKIKLLPETDARKPYPLDWSEQDRLFAQLPPHLREMALFAVNTGCRDQELCHLRWNWERPVYAHDIGSVFVVPGSFVKNGEDRLIVLNPVARAVIDRQRGKHPERVFTYKGSPTKQMLNNGWKKARIRAGLPQVRVHDLKHTFGRRLRAAGVSFEDRQDLLGHKSTRITTHYSSAELLNLWKAANSVCGERRDEVSLMKLAMLPKDAKVAQQSKG